MNSTNNSGFTLLELMLSLALTAALFVMLFIPVQMAGSLSALALSKERSQGNVREVLRALKREMEVGTDGENVPLGVTAATVTQNGAAVAAGATGNEFTFQIPLVVDPDDASEWSTPILYRFISEDTDGNGLLDTGEDTDGDGLLTRRLFRMQDTDGDAAFTSPGETRVVGAANSLANMTFSLNADGDMITINVVSTQAIRNTTSINELDEVETQRIVAQAGTQIYILN